VVDFQNLESLKLALHEWEHNMLDNQVRVRAFVKCNPGPQVFREVDLDLFESFSNEIVLNIDLRGPEVFSTFPLRPFPGVDELVVSLTEDVR
jgi:hypothetical protein